MNTKKLWAIHHWLGLYTGIMLIILSFSGAMAVFKQEIDELLNPRLYNIEKEEGKKSLQEVYDAFKPTRDSLLANKHVPISIKLPTTETSPYIFNFFYKAPGGIKGILKDEQREYFINPYTLAISWRNRQQTFTQYIRSLHVHLYEFYLGRYITGFFGLSLLFLVITGFIIYGGFMKSIPFGKIRRENTRKKWADIHKLIGIWALVFNFTIAITGAWLGLERIIAAPFKEPKAILTKEQVTQKLQQMEEEKLLEPDYTKIITLTKTHFKEMIPSYIISSANGDKTVTVQGNIPGQVYRKGSAKLVFDMQTNEIIKKQNIAKSKASEKLYYMQEALHYGDFGGMAIKALYCLFGIITGILSISGYFIYLRRNKKISPEQISNTLWKYAVLIGGGMFLLYLITVYINSGVAYAITTISFYLIVSFLIIRGLIRIITKKVGANKQTLNEK